MPNRGYDSNYRTRINTKKHVQVTYNNYVYANNTTEIIEQKRTSYKKENVLNYDC